MSTPAPVGRARPGRPATPGRLGAMFWLALAWTLFEFGRPPTPPLGPLMLSAGLFAWWVVGRDKAMERRDMWWFVVIGVAAYGIAFAENNFSAFQATKFFAMLFIGICLPFQALFTTLPRIRGWVLGFVAVALYVALWAISHGGYGPAAGAGQDENYVATLMGMGAAFAYFALFAERSTLLRGVLAAALVVFVAALAAANNASRGGFLALCVVAAYGVYRSPRRLLGFGIILTGGVALLAIAGSGFWAEISSSTDYSSGTGDMRLELWKTGLRMWQSYPVFGVGGGNFLWRVGDFQTADQFEKFGRSLGGSIVAHSMPIELISELGTVGALGTGALVWNTWRGLGGMLLAPLKVNQHDTPPIMVAFSCYADAIRGGMIAVLVSGIFLSLLYYSHIWVLIAVGNGLILCHRRMLRQESATASVLPSHLRARGGR